MAMPSSNSETERLISVRCSLDGPLLNSNVAFNGLVIATSVAEEGLDFKVSSIDISHLPSS